LCRTTRDPGSAVTASRSTRSTSRGKARQHGVNTRFIELAGEVNRAMPEWVVNKIAAALNERSKAIKGSRILVLGIAYKKNVDDVRESPAAAIMELLRDRGAVLSYSDPHVPRFPKMREHRFDLSSVDLTRETLASQDCVVVVTDHDRFDFEAIATHARLVVDTRGRYPMTRHNVVKA
jgi:UDP-N-acetyl-D-glucosamine dehydrogenase